MANMLLWSRQFSNGLVIFPDPYETADPDDPNLRLFFDIALTIKNNKHGGKQVKEAAQMYIERFNDMYFEYVGRFSDPEEGTDG